MGSRDPLLEFWDPLISRELLKLETSNLAWRRRAVSSNEKKFKIGSKRVMWRSSDTLLEFWAPLISRERLKLETSNLARRRSSLSSNEKMQNWVKRGHVGVTWPTFGILGPPNILGTVEARNFKFGTETEGGEFWRKKMQNWVKRGYSGVTWPTFGILGPN